MITFYKYRSAILLILSLVAIYFMVVFWYSMKYHNNLAKEKSMDNEVDLIQIIDRGRLDVCMAYNSLNYYIIHGRPSGFQYHFAKYFADHLGVDLNIIVANNIGETISYLSEGKCDVICADMTLIEGRFGDSIVFANPYTHTKQVLIQRLDNAKFGIVNSFEELIGKTIYIPDKSIFRNILEEFYLNIPRKPYIIDAIGYGSEELIDAVACGKISYTISDIHLARYHSCIYDNLIYGPEIGEEMSLAWCMRNSSIKLLKEFNDWFEVFSQSREFKYLHHQYFFESCKKYKKQGDFFSVKTKKLSPYDDLIKKYSEKIGWDWRLVASLIYEETKFDPDVVSYAGAFGIMQLMPVTAQYFGVDENSSVEDHIRAGTEFLKMMEGNFLDKVPDSTERIKFVLASYNVGEGHILDAMALAEKYNKNSKIWDKNVELFLSRKNQPLYFKDDVVKYGYCKGIVTVFFVKNILERYEHYKNAFN